MSGAAAATAAALTAPQRLSPQEFFSAFPVPPDEAERRLRLRAKRVDQLRPPLRPLDDALLRMAGSDAAEGGALGASLCGLTVTLVGEAEQTVLAQICRDAGGAWVGISSIASWPPIPRKLTNCQYVVASGEVECVNKTNLRIADDERAKLLPSLAQGDPAVADSLAPGGYLAMLKAHHASVLAGGGVADPMLSLALQTISREHQYLGAPLRVQGAVVGALCAWFTDKEAVEAHGRRAALQERADLVAAVIEQVCPACF